MTYCIFVRMLCKVLVLSTVSQDSYLVINSAATAGQAALLSGNSSISGLVWTSVDSSCRLHYSIRIEGADTDTLESTLGNFSFIVP